MIHLVLLLGNSAGWIFCVASFGIAMAVGAAVGIVAEGQLMMIAAPLLTVFDLAYRWWHRANLFVANAGGSLLFLPVWQWGIFWFLLGLIYTLT